jgi:hypothetical protein
MYAAAAMIAASLVLGNMSTSLILPLDFLRHCACRPQVEGEIVIFAVRSMSSVTTDRRIDG